MGNRDIARSKQEVGVVVAQGPGETSGIRRFNQIAQPGKETKAIPVVAKNPLAIDASDDNVVKRSRRIDPGFAWHAFQISDETTNDKLKY